MIRSGEKTLTGHATSLLTYWEWQFIGPFPPENGDRTKKNKYEKFYEQIK